MNGSNAICERCGEHEATEVLYHPKDFAIHGADPPDSVLHPVCGDCYDRFASAEQKAGERRAH